MLIEPLLATNPNVRGQRGRLGRPRRRPAKLHADKGYNYPSVLVLPAPTGHQVADYPAQDRSQYPPGPALLVLERNIFSVLRFKSLGLRYDRTEATLLPMLLLAVTLINLRRLRQATEL